ncbi:hypothetical protein LINGRAHAP2_LOCUS31610 [Linum grandiflorum]
MARPTLLPFFKKPSTISPSFISSFIC